MGKGRNKKKVKQNTASKPLLSCIFRIVRLEVDKIKDHNYLFGLFASITSLVSIIIAVIAVVKGA